MRSDVSPIEPSRIAQSLGEFAERHGRFAKLSILFLEIRTSLSLLHKIAPEQKRDAPIAAAKDVLPGSHNPVNTKTKSKLHAGDDSTNRHRKGRLRKVSQYLTGHHGIGPDHALGGA